MRIARTANLFHAMPHRCEFRVRVVRGRAGDAVAGKAFGDRVDPVPGGELGEDPLDHRRRHRGSRSRRCSRLPSAALAGLGCAPRRRSGSRRWAPAEESALILAWAAMAARTRILIRFRSPLLIPPNTDIDQVVGLVARVDRTADLGHPQRDAVVVEQRETSDRTGCRKRRAAAPRSRRPRSRAWVPARPAAGSLPAGAATGVSGTCRRRRTPRRSSPPCGSISVLPARVAARIAGRLGVLLVLGGHPAVERKLDHLAAPRGSSVPLSFSLALTRIRSSAFAAPGVRRGGSSGRTTRTAFSSIGVRRAARPGLTWACYRMAGFAICEPLSRPFSFPGG